MRLFFALYICAGAVASQAVPPGPVVFSELMWMGSSASSADEWIELYNRSGRRMDLAGWTLTRITGEGEQIMLEIEQGTIGPGEVFLIANYGPDDPRSRLEVEPDLVRTAVSLPNSRLQLRLYDAPPGRGGRLIDEADDGRGAPFAGDAALKRSMVRTAFDQEGADPASWDTAREASGWDPGSSELGTPGRIPERLRPGGSGSPTLLPPRSWARLKAEP